MKIIRDIACGMNQRSLFADLCDVDNESIISTLTVTLEKSKHLLALMQVPEIDKSLLEWQAWTLLVSWIKRQDEDLEIGSWRLKALHKLITGTSESTGKVLEVCSLYLHYVFETDSSLEYVQNSSASIER